MRCFYFGCWNAAGHYLFAPGGGSPGRAARKSVVYYGGDTEERMHLDGTLAPRNLRGRELWWVSKSPTRRERDVNGFNSHEYPQGQFLLHVLDNGYTAIQWWDRCQGDSRGACNSTILLEGVHTADEMVAAAREHFPHVLENLERAGVELVNVTPLTRPRSTEGVVRL